MDYKLPTTLLGLINGVLVERDISSWRIYGGKQVVISIRFNEEARHETINSPVNSSYVHQACKGYRTKPPSSIARDHKRQVQWAAAAPNQGPSGSDMDNNIDEPESHGQLFVNRESNEDSGLCFDDSTYSMRCGSDHELMTDISVSTEHNFNEKDIQCTSYDISTAPVAFAETQTSRAHKSKCVQVGHPAQRDKSFQATVQKQCALINTETVNTMNRYTTMHRHLINEYCQASDTKDQSSQCVVDNVTTHTSTHDKPPTKDSSSQIQPDIKTVCTSTTEEFYDEEGHYVTAFYDEDGQYIKEYFDHDGRYVTEYYDEDVGEYVREYDDEDLRNESNFRDGSEHDNDYFSCKEGMHYQANTHAQQKQGQSSTTWEGFKPP